MTTYKELAGLYGYRDTPSEEIHESFRQIDLDERDYNGSTPLHLACRHADETAVHILLERGADVQAKDNAGKTALDYAMECGARRIGALLAGHDPDDELQALAGGMNIFQALYYKDMQAVDALLRMGTDLQTVCEREGDLPHSYSGKSPLACALAAMNTEAVEMLLMGGADPNFVFPDERTAFATWVESSISSADDETKANPILNLMLQCGWDMEAPADREGNTPLSIACRHAGHELGYAAAKFLLKNGANANAANNQGQTPAMNLYGAQFWDGHIPRFPQLPRSYPYGNRISQDAIADIFELLLEKGASTDATDKWGNTLLHYIASSAFGAQAKAAAELLSDYGMPDIEAVNDEGKTAMDIAAAHRNEVILKYLLKNS